MVEATAVAFILTCSFLTALSDKTWLFAVDGNRRPLNFIDADGYVEGADLDLITAVCTIAGKTCEVTVQPYEECIRSVRDRIFPGIGIMGQWYDACVGYVSIPERINSVKFTDAYSQTKVTFTVAPGNPRNFDPADVSNRIITHLNGAFTSSSCLRRLNKVPKGVIIVNELDEVRALLLNGSADELFSPRTHITGLEVLPGRYDCTSGGVGMMVRKDSLLPEWWNPAFQVFYRSGKYTEWCTTIPQKYGGHFDTDNCLPAMTNAGTASEPLKTHICSSNSCIPFGKRK